MPIRIDAALRQARDRLDAVDAELLLAHVLGKSRSWLFAHGDDVLDAAAEEEFLALRERRVAGEPVAYLTGRRGFWRFDLQVTPDTLVPRPETELLVELALARMPANQPLRVADLGTGSGAIALALAFERPHAHVVATDASTAALAIAEANARELKLANIEFRHGEWCEPLHGERFDLVASNPPFIADDDPHLAALRHEPRTALASGTDGLDDIRHIVAQAPPHLTPHGWLLLEHGHDQGAAVRALLQHAGFIDVDTVVDLERRDRVTLGRRPD
jgi:release factor glutamine methyltransferase